jgi:Fe-S cluster assembly protein SufB
VQSIRTRPFKGDLVKIRPLSPGNTFQLTPEHPVLAVKREQVRVKRQSHHGWQPEVNTQALAAAEPEYIEAGKLTEGDFLVFPVCKVTNDLPSYTPDVMRLLGYYLAEGSAYVHTTLNMPVVAFSLGIHETEVIDEIKALVERVVGKPAYQVDQEERHASSLTVHSRELMEFCTEACGKGAGEKRLSQAVMELPPDKQAYLLETYFKSDGSVYEKDRTMIRASTASPVLAAQLQELLARQGLYASIMIRKGGEDSIQGHRVERQDQYVLYYSLDKTHSEVRKVNDHFLVPIKAIERVPYDGPVFNFEVVGTPNSYLVRGFAVHNCTAPIYASDSLHSAVVEIIVKKNGRCRYSTIQNWSSDVYNLVTKRAMAYEGATMEWIDANLGSRVTMKYPAVYMMGPKAHGEILSIAFAGHGQTLDAGGKVIHAAPNTSSKIMSKSISKNGGRASYRGLLKVAKGATGSKSTVVCDALLLDDHSRSDTYPSIEIDEQDVQVGHEASVSKVNEEQIFYLMSRGLGEEEAATMIVSGFIEPMVKELPMEYAVEMNRLIQLQMEGSIG